MRCKNCSKDIDKDSKFCPFCGEKTTVSTKEDLLDVEEEFLNHLEFLGYELIDQDPVGDAKRYLAKHKSRFNLMINAVRDVGLSIVSFWNLDQKKVKDNHLDILETINRMNSRALVCSFWLLNGLNSFGAGSLYIGEYTKKHFAEFLELFDNDIKRRFAEEDYLKKFS